MKEILQWNNNIVLIFSVIQNTILTSIGRSVVRLVVSSTTRYWYESEVNIGVLSFSSVIDIVTGRRVSIPLPLLSNKKIGI